MATSERKYLLDTNTVSDYLDKRRSSQELRRRMLARSPSQLLITAITIEEIVRGHLGAIRAAQSGKGSLIRAYANLATAVQALQQFSILPYSEDAERVYEAFPTRIKRIGTNDCRIAAAALAHGCILVTANLEDFQQVEDLEAEDWMEA